MTEEHDYNIRFATYITGNNKPVRCVCADVESPEIPDGLLERMVNYAVEGASTVKQRAVSILEAGLTPRLEYWEAPRWVDPTEEPDLIGLCHLEQLDTGELVVWLFPVANPYKLN